MVSRRGFLKVVGGSTVIVAASLGGFAATRTPTKALEPWRLAGATAYTDPRMRALSFAILAPNPHNRQPWMVDLQTPGEAVLYCDLDRLLPETDPPNRQITIGLGCFLELLRMAAAEEGWRAVITPFPDGAGETLLDERPVAHIRFEEGGAERDPLFGHVLARRSVKSVYDTNQPVSDETLEALQSVAREPIAMAATNDKAKVSALRDLTWQAHVLEATTPRTWQESVDLMRIGKREINENPDGLEIGGTVLELFALTGEMTREKMADPNSLAFKQGLAMFEPIMKSGMGYIWLKTAGNTRLDQLATGRDWVRLNLMATKLGVGLHPHSQALQEFAEMTPLYTRLHALLGVDMASGARVQMFGRLGYAAYPGPTPRWRAEHKVLSAS